MSADLPLRQCSKKEDAAVASSSAQHLPDTAHLPMKGRSFSEPAGRNWHLETYTIRKTR